ncbi:aspartate kinase [Hymenobacter terrestris]|uniref:Aspartokinase n=1 Tax=Hymenobacter terrestris TaxID=2748310 RepID=A0ABX2Q3S6_9BACT|nr:aspartate kinase [Hymenobacter terrestris]NVO84374.1 aspartate kinase [Hymenobacter terrestris]
MKILKFGGTSVGSAPRMREVAELMHAPHLQRRLVVLSAMSGTTNALVELAGLLYARNAAPAAAHLEQLRQHYQAVAHELLGATEAASFWPTLDQSFQTLHELAANLPLTAEGERVILAQGELLSTRLMYGYVTTVLGRPAVLLPALDFMRLNADGEPDVAAIRQGLATALAPYPNDALFITQGFICRDAHGRIDNLRRGGSDYSASLIGAALQAEEIQIWTDIDGLHNNDPRVVAGTYPVRELSFDEAAELAYFGAKILHPSSVLPARAHGIPVRLLNTMQPDAPGTLISARTGSGSIKAIAAKDGITAINVKSSRMLLAHGFLRSLFEVFERHRTAIDMITTSEVAVSLTIDDAGRLPQIVAELQDFGAVAVDENQSIICLVGSLTQDANGSAHRAFAALRDVPVRMISYGGSPNNISILVSTEDKVRALRALNAGLFEERK